MVNTLTGATTDIMHDVWTCSTDDAWMGAMTDELYDVQMEGTYDGSMDGTDNAWTGAMTDVLYSVQTGGDFIMILCRYFTACFSQLILGLLSFSADSDQVMNGLPDGSTDESADV